MRFIYVFTPQTFGSSEKGLCNCWVPTNFVRSFTPWFRNFQTGSPAIQIRDFSFVLVGQGIPGRVGTALNLRDGEKVVGTATIDDIAFIVVLIPKFVN